MTIIPAILSDSIDTVVDQLHKVKEYSSLPRVQIDIVDPDFADNITITPIDLTTVALPNLAIDIHLMTNEPINDVSECSQIPGIHSVIGQIEHMHSQAAFVEEIRNLSLHAGLSLDLYTGVDALDPAVLRQVAIVQVMGNKAGEQGKPFAGDLVLEKIRTLKALRLSQHFSFEIAVDIGMTPETVALVGEAGATECVVGSFLWKADDFSTALRSLTVASDHS